MKTIYAYISPEATKSGEQILLFAQGDPDAFGKLMGGIRVGYIRESHKTSFATSMDALSHMNYRIAETLRVLRRDVHPGWCDAGNETKITELIEMRDLFVRLFTHDDCYLVRSGKSSCKSATKEAVEPAQAQAVTRPIPAPRKRLPTAAMAIAPAVPPHDDAYYEKHQIN